MVSMRLRARVFFLLEATLDRLSYIIKTHSLDEPKLNNLKSFYAHDEVLFSDM